MSDVGIDWVPVGPKLPETEVLICGKWGMRDRVIIGYLFALPDGTVNGVNETTVIYPATHYSLPILPEVKSE